MAALPSMKNITKKKLHNRLLQYEIAAIATFVILVLLGGVIYFVVSRPEFEGSKHLVTIYDQGVKRVVLTRAATVGAALEAADIKVDSRDKTEPSLEAKLTSSYVDVIIYRSRLIAITDGGTRQSVLTVAQSPNAILNDAKLESLGSEDKVEVVRGNFAIDGTATVLKIERVKPKEEPKPQKPVFIPKPNALTASKGAHIYVDNLGVAHRETYYDLPMNIVIGACGPGNSYSIRSEDGAKIDKDGYILVAANYGSYPRCSVVDTSMGPGKVYDTGGFALRHPYGFDLATDWTNYNGL